MSKKILAALVVPLLATACADDPYYAARTDTTQSVSYVPGGQFDIDRGVWGTQTITPPPGLVTTKQSDIVGRTIYDRDGQSALMIETVLADPRTGEARYAVTSSRDFGDYLVVPASVLRISPSMIQVDMTRRQLALMPRFTSGDLVARFPQHAFPGPVAIVPAPAYPAPVLGVPPVAVLPAPAPVYQYPVLPTPPAEALQLARRGSVVGLPVVDSSGQTVGYVDSLAIVPTSGEVRHVIVAGPSFGQGYYIAMPAMSTYLNTGRVVLMQTAPNWMQSLRYTAMQVQQVYGSLGVLG
ncbi:MAG: hypothetical protein FJX35_04585 [Alphaproteobacteria bacterium]|nr:hypothetical protein [Alphaproteobacteria bacterium]